MMSSGSNSSTGAGKSGSNISLLNSLSNDSVKKVGKSVKLLIL